MSESQTAPPVTPLGVGFDTARYGHHVTFLRDDLQPACPAFDFAESRAGYDRLRQQLQTLAERLPHVHFHLRLDAAGQYACNLEAFLRELPFPKTLTVGEPARNANYRKALFPKRKADPVESHCAARFALRERPQPTPALAPAFHHLRAVLQRLQAQTRQATRLTNQLHNLLARVFPELALQAPDLQARWVLTLLEHYPTPQQLGRARLTSLTALPHLTQAKAEALHQAARATVASFGGAGAEPLVRLLVRQLRDCLVHEGQLHDLLAAAYRQLPQDNHLDTIPGIGVATAAVLTAAVVRIEQFATPDRLVGYFGIFAEEDESGYDRHGQPKARRQQRMSRKGSDLVRKYLWNAAKVAARYNPAVRALYQRLRAKGTRGDVALGHCMRKLLHLAYAVWKTGRPFDPEHYPWEGAKQAEEAAGHNQGPSPATPVVTAATVTVTQPQPPCKSAPAPARRARSGPSAEAAGSIDYAGLRAQVRLEAVLARLGWLESLRGAGAQRRGPCPLHDRAERRHHSFSVNLDKGLFQCFHEGCRAHGNVLDLWAALKGLPLYEAALDLAATFEVKLQPKPGTEKRNP